MIFFKDKKKNFGIIFLSFLVLTILLILIFSPKNNFKGNLEQSILIFLKEPFLSERGNYFKLKAIPEIIVNNLKFKKKHKTIYIDIDQKNLNKIKNSRTRSIKNKVLTKSEYVSLKIRLDKKEYEARAKLKGIIHTHWDRNKQWSLNFKIDNGNSIFGFKEFSLTRHSERQFPVNQLVSKYLSRLDISVPEFKTVNVILNGEDWGLMLIEEQISNAYLEKRKLRDSLVFKLTDKYGFLNELKHFYKQKINMDDVKNLNFLQNKYGLITYNSKKKFNPSSNDNLGLNKQYSKIINLKNNNDLAKIIDISKFAQVFAMSLIWGELHSLKNVNTRYYLNPYTSKLEIIPNDFNYYMDSSNYKFLEMNFKENPQLLYGYLKSAVFKENSNFKKIFKSKEFETELKKSLENIKRNFKDFYSDLNDLCSSYSTECRKIVNLKSVEINLSYTSENLDEIIKTLRSDESIKKNISFVNSLNNLDKNQKKLFIDLLEHPLQVSNIENKYIEIINTTPFNIKINKILITNNNKFKENLNYEDNKNYHILPSKKDKPSKIQLKISEQVKEKLKINNQNKSFLNITFHLEIQKIQKIQKIDIFNTHKNIKEKFNSNNFLKIKNKNYIISKGVWIANNPIIIPEGFNLIIKEGAEIYFDEKSFIFIKNGKLITEGSKKKPIKLNAKNLYWAGIYVKGNSQQSKLNHTNIYKTNYFNNKTIFLTGGVNFYGSFVKIENCLFKDSIAEDTLNLVNSKFNIINSKFINAKSDAIDLDFSKGVIKNTDFANIGGDAVDSSGTQLEVQRLNFKDIVDKSISAGEKSKLTGNNIIIENSNISIASKDSSYVDLTNISIINSKIADLMTYKKKSFYSYGVINIKNSNIDQDKIYSQSEKLISIDGKKINESLNLRKNIRKNIDYPFFYDQFVELLIDNQELRNNSKSCLNMKCLSEKKIKRQILYENNILN